MKMIGGGPGKSQNVSKTKKSAIIEARPVIERATRAGQNILSDGRNPEPIHLSEKRQTGLVPGRSRSAHSGKPGVIKQSRALLNIVGRYFLA
jgi:hypothetical protein